MNGDDTLIASFEHNEIGGNTIRAGPDHDVIEPLVRELAVLGDPSRDWAQEIDEEMGSTIQAPG
jgi:hypothetical protein